MTKKKIKYPNGGTLTTGTPEYNAYIANQNRYKEWQERHDKLASSGLYKDSGTADKALTQSLNQQFGFDETNTPSGYKRYTYQSGIKPVDIGTDKFYTTPTAPGSSEFYYYSPYYDQPEEATIVKSEAELAAEKQQADNAAVLKQFQGEVHEVVYNPQTGQNEVVKKQIPVGEDISGYTGSGKYFPYNVTPQYAGGGKLGDTLKITGDTLLSTIGLTDVIGDAAYTNQGFADASRVAETVGTYAGKIGANLIAPGIGGAVMNTVQGGFSTLDGEDKRREYMDRISSLQSQGELGKFNNAAYSVPQNLNTINAITTGVGEVGNFLSNPGVTSGIKNQIQGFNLPVFPFGGNPDKRKEAGFTLRPNQYGNQNYFDYMKTQAQILEGINPTLLTNTSGQTEFADVPEENTSTKVGLIESMGRAMRVNKNTRQQDRDFERVKLNAFVNRMGEDQNIATFACGGKMDKYADGGKFIEYNGPDHSGGGIPIDQNGQPTNQMNAQAEVEGGETMHDDDIEKYIFSDRLMFDPKSKLTFADQSKKINRKYKDVETDKFQKQARDLELNRLKQEQEIFKASMVQSQTQQPIMANGGLVPIPEKDFSNFNLEGSPYNMPTQITPYSNEYLDTMGYKGSEYIHVTEPDMMFEETRIIYDEQGNPTQSRTPRLQQIINDSNSNQQNKIAQTSNGLPQDSINPLGYAASNIGNIYDLYQSAKPAQANKFGYVDLAGIDLSAQRRELEKQNALAKNINRESVRSTATSSGQAMTNQIIGNALANSALGSGLSESFLNEVTANNQIANQEKLTNAQIKQQEILADQMDKAKRQSTTSGALHNIGMNTQGYARDLKSAKVGNQNNALWFDAIKEGKYTQLGFDTNGKMVIQLQDGRTITQP